MEWVFVIGGAAIAIWFVGYVVYLLVCLTIEQDAKARFESKKAADEAWERWRDEREARFNQDSREASQATRRTTREEHQRLLEMVGIGYHKAAAKINELRTLNRSISENMERRRYEDLPPPPMHQIQTRPRRADEQSEIYKFLKADPCGLLLLLALHERQKIWGTEERVLQRHAVKSMDTFGMYLHWLGECVEIDHHGVDTWAEQYIAARIGLARWYDQS